MRTDKELFQIFQACPEMLFLLAHLPAPRGCKLTSVSVKDIERVMDGLIIPDDPDEPLTIAEFQFQRCLDIYRRIIIEMALMQREHPKRGVQGIICFAEASLDPATEPWKSSGLIRCVYLKEGLQAIEREVPDHPLVAVFKPVFEPSNEALEREAKIHYRHLSNNDLETSQRDTLCRVFLNLLTQRLGQLTPEQLAMILDLPDIRDTVCGRELIAEGKVEQSRAIAGSLATDKFGPLPAELEARIQKLDLSQSNELCHSLFRMSDLSELRTWFQERTV